MSFGKGKEKSEKKKKTACLLSVSLLASSPKKKERKRKRRTKDSPRRRRQQRVGERRRSAVVGRVGGSSVRVSQREREEGQVEYVRDVNVSVGKAVSSWEKVGKRTEGGKKGKKKEVQTQRERGA